MATIFFFIFKAQETHKSWVIFLGLIIYFFDTSSQSKRIKIMHCWTLNWLACFTVCTLYILLDETKGQSRYNRPRWLNAVEVYHTCLVQASHFPKTWIQIWMVWVLPQNPKEHTVVIPCVCLNLYRVGMSWFGRPWLRFLGNKVIYIKTNVYCFAPAYCLQFHSSPKLCALLFYFFGSWTLNSRIFLF